jgi:methyltransferase family protein
MAFEDLMAAIQQRLVGMQALAALGAGLELRLSQTDAPPEVAAQLRAVETAMGLDDLDDIPPPQQAIALGLIRTYVAHAVELLDDPAREPGWTYTEPTILDGWGRASTMVPAMIKTAPELQHVESFLDVGTGVGLLAVAAASIWPDATVTGIDVWGPSLDRARANVKEAALDERITLRNQDVRDLDDVDAFDCAWVPTFFLPSAALRAALPRVVAAVRPGGWIVLGRLDAPPDPLARATHGFATVRDGGGELASEHAIELLAAEGCCEVRVLPRPGSVPLELVIGQRPLD